VDAILTRTDLRVELDAAFARNASLINKTSVGDVSSTNFVRDCKSVIFNDSEGNEAGRLSWANGTISFSGNMDKSATLFFSTLQDLWYSEK